MEGVQPPKSRTDLRDSHVASAQGWGPAQSQSVSSPSEMGWGPSGDELVNVCFAEPDIARGPVWDTGSAAGSQQGPQNRRDQGPLGWGLAWSPGENGKPEGKDPDLTGAATELRESLVACSSSLAESCR